MATSVVRGCRTSSYWTRQAVVSSGSAAELQRTRRRTASPMHT